MNKSIIALACAVVLGGLFVQDAEARHHHGHNRGCDNNGWRSSYNNGWGRGNGWGNRRYANAYYNNGYNGYNGYNNYNGYRNNGLAARILNWR